MISWEDFNKRSIDLFIQFDLAKKAISGFRETPEALKCFAEKELDSLKKDMQGHFEKKGKDIQKSWMYDETKADTYIQSTIDSVPSRLEEIENRLNQNHIILLVTLFESFMKDIHKEILTKNPKLLNPDRKIPLGRAVNDGLNKIIEEEISREVHSVDRKAIEDRCKYFKERLSIDWSFDNTAIPLIKSTLEVRNTILHDDPNFKVDRLQLQVAMAICMGITMVSTVQAHLLYPESFESPDKSGKLTEHFKKILNK